MSKPKSKTGQGNKQTSVKSEGIRFVSWFEKHFRLLTITILVMAALLRLSLLLELPRMPFSELYKAPDLDMNFFDQWGDRIAGGDFLTDTIWHPYHFWHAEISKAYGLKTDEEGKQKWNEWYGGKQYHQEPLYAQVTGLAKMIDGEGRMLVYILQMLLSLLSIWMVIWLGRHYFTAMAGIAGGLLFTFYGPGLLFDVMLIRTSLSTTLLLGCLVTAEQLMQGKKRAWVMGLIGGAGYLLMTTVLLLWIPLVARWLYLRRQDMKHLWKVAGAFGLFLSLLVIRNSVVGAPLFSSSSVGPVTYVLSNFPTYKPEIGFVYFVTAGTIMEASHGKMIPAALEVIKLHDHFTGWIVLQFKKLGMVFHWYEIPNNINTYLSAEFSNTLKVTIIPYSLIAALGLAGMFLNLRNKKVINLHIGILSQVAVMVIFYVLCRFRVPMVAMLCVFAGATLQQLAEFKNPLRYALIVAGVVAIWLFILRPEPAIPATYTRGDLSTNFNVYCRPKLDSLISKGDIQGCVNLIEEFTITMPPYLRDVNHLKALETNVEKEVAYYYSLLYGDLAGLYTELGNERAAKESKRKESLLLAVSGIQ